MNTQNKDEELFVSRIEELCRRCTERYSPQFTVFLDGRKKNVAERCVACYRDSVVPVFFGGFDDAERCVLGLFPKDIYGFLEQFELYELFDIKFLKIKGSGFSSFSHRDCMGSILALGITRESMGDIFVPDDGKEAYVVLSNVAAEYVLQNLDFVARDKVRTTLIEYSVLPKPERKFQAISGTVASFRLDCVLAMCTGLSREKAKQMITSGLVNVNHFEELRCDIDLCEKDVISVRGKGRFVVETIGDLTRKGRNRVVVHKMI